MNISKKILAFVSFALWFSLAPASRAETEFLLVNGERAVIEGRKLILIGRDSRRWTAPDGKYHSKGERYTITVKGNEIWIKDRMKGRP
ncbi:MAG: hypothetical protein C4529_02540 [Deltaproteobacteria bacterium]|nr:MAG: hypothetical protein C4529_02540 [Deltaproteobacteria bacterium]